MSTAAHEGPVSARGHVQRVAKEIGDLAVAARARAEVYAEEERRAQLREDSALAEEHAAHALICRGKAIAYEDAGVLVSMLAARIPVGA